MTYHHEEDIQVDMNQALLFRLASGDSNRIHVDPTASALRPEEEQDITNATGSKRQQKKPALLMHGLGTLGMVVRVILKFLSSSCGDGVGFSVDALRAKFSKPVFIGDQLSVRLAWATNSSSDNCLLYTSPSPRDQRGSRMPSSA